MKFTAIIRNISLAAIMATALTACDDFKAEPPIILPEGGAVGSGLWNDPLTAYQVQIGSVNEEMEEIWATGYIVGVVNTEIGNTLNQRCAQFEPAFNEDKNMLISIYTPTELKEKFMVTEIDEESGEEVVVSDTRWEHVATVQLPSGNCRNDLNLASNPGNLGRQVTIHGTVGVKYCGCYGVKGVNDYEWGAVGKEPVVLPAITGPFFVDWDQAATIEPWLNQGWKKVAVKGGLSGWYIKTFSGNNYVTTSAYLGSATGGPYENWLITPAIDLDALTDKTLSFITQAAYSCPDPSYLEVYVMSTDNPTKAELNKLEATIATPPEGSAYSQWINSGTLDLSGFSGTIYIGWKYYSAHGGSGFSTTFCIDDINVGNAQP
ncbi:MAG: choice-of-anchor J domain-containing protein [Muribaculaceae bacterium]|nr:choice-of-anchor J domain-containing protein [Muribaculaceae bacterium]